MLTNYPPHAIDSPTFLIVWTGEVLTSTRIWMDDGTLRTSLKSSEVSQTSWSHGPSQLSGSEWESIQKERRSSALSKLFSLLINGLSKTNPLAIKGQCSCLGHFPLLSSSQYQFLDRSRYEITWSSLSNSFLSLRSRYFITSPFSESQIVILHYTISETHGVWICKIQDFQS